MKMKNLYFFFVLSILIGGCRGYLKTDATPDTLHPAPAKPARVPSQVDSAVARVSTDTTLAPKSDLPPIATPIPTDRLAQFLPKLDGYSEGEIEQETKIRKNFNSAKVSRTYTKDSKKVTIEINDYAYVPFLYEPFAQFKDTYLDDNNDERTETTTIAGFRGVQTWEKKNFAATIFVFPGKRFVVKLQADGLENLTEARDMIALIDLKGLESIR